MLQNVSFFINSFSSKNKFLVLISAPVDFNFNSSSRNTELTQRLKITEKLVADLMKHSDAWPFLKPVTKREVNFQFSFSLSPQST